MAYEVKLAQFEGPLDLLLHLIQDAELDIKDIFVSEITAQYLSYMDQVDELDLDTASEFLTMAATLVYIKSRQLLPRPPKEVADEESPEEMLIRQLRAYQAFKAASAQLGTLYAEAKTNVARLPEDVPLPPKNVALEGASIDGLYGAFLSLLQRVEAAKPDEAKRSLHNVRPDAYTVRRQIGKIRTVLTEHTSVEFSALFDADTTRMEMIVTFMALLEMLAAGEVELRQSAPFAPIRIRAGSLRQDGDDEYRYMDEEEL